jgi:hypothetical protein
MRESAFETCLVIIKQGRSDLRYEFFPFSRVLHEFSLTLKIELFEMIQISICNRRQGEHTE